MFLLVEGEGTLHSGVDFLFDCFFLYNYAAKLTGVVNAVRHSVAPQNVITVREQLL